MSNINILMTFGFLKEVNYHNTVGEVVNTIPAASFKDMFKKVVLFKTEQQLSKWLSEYDQKNIPLFDGLRSYEIIEKVKKDGYFMYDSRFACVHFSCAKAPF